MPKREHFKQCLSAFLAIGLTTMLCAPSVAEDTTKVASFDQASGARYFAMSISLDPERFASKSTEVVLLVDTSASQMSVYRTDSIATVNEVVKNLPADTKVQIVAGDLWATSLSEGFVAPGSEEMKTAIAKLSKRTPLGATDLAGLIHESVAMFSDKDTNRALIYIGDGASHANHLSRGEFQGCVNALRDSKVAMSSLAIGPLRELDKLAAFANHSGGMLLVDSTQVTPKEMGAELASIATKSVIWPASADFSENVDEFYPTQIPAMRPDRDSIIVGTLKSGKAISVTLDTSDSQTIQLQSKLNASNEDTAYLPHLLKKVRKDNGLTLESVGAAGLEEVVKSMMTSAKHYTQLGSQALSIGDFEGAKRLAGAAIEIDPSNPEAIAILNAAKKAEQSNTEKPEPTKQSRVVRQIPTFFVAFQNDDAEADAAAPLTLGEDDGAFLNDVQQERIRRARVIEADVEMRLVAARETMATDPDGTRDALKLLLANVSSAPDLDASIRTRLRNALIGAIREASARSVAVESARQAAAEREAIARERDALTDQLLRDQERAKSLLLMFDALIDEGRDQQERQNQIASRFVEDRQFSDARAAAIKARQLDGYNQAAVVAVDYALLAGNHARVMAIREDRIRGVVETLFQSERASIPFPDEPPVVYPATEFWEGIYYRKEKYGSVDLASTGKAEQRINQQLQSETKIQFIDTPLEEVVGYLKQLHGIEIQIDTRALEDVGLSTDTPITRNIEGISLRSALRLMLKEVDLTYIVANEVLMITTPEEAEADLITKVYPVADLVLPIGQNAGNQGNGVNFNTGQNRNNGNQGVGVGFAVADEKSEADIDDTKPVEGKQTPVKFILEVKDDESRSQAWSRVLESGQVVPQNAVRSEVKRAMNTHRYDEAVSLIQSALLNGQPQPWMYEAMAIALKLSKASDQKIERTMMSAVDFTSGPNHLMMVASYLTRLDLDERALMLYQDVSEVEPLRPEPYMLGLSAAKRLDNKDGIRWACKGILSQEWPKDRLELRNEAFNTAKAMLSEMVAENHPETKQFGEAIRDALVRDLIVKVTWGGDADLDILVEEPSGSVCSQHNPRTTSGGIFLGDAVASVTDDLQADGVYELYVVPKGFAGDYKMLVKRIYGDVTANTITVDIFTNYGHDNQTHQRQQIEIGKDGALVNFSLEDGRRRESLAEHQVEVAAETQAMVSRDIINQQIESASYDSTATDEYVQETANNSNDFVERSRNAVGYRPVITTLQSGAQFTPFAVISPDRRYVRFTNPAQSSFRQIGQVSSFTFQTGITGDIGNGGGDNNNNNNNNNN